MKYTIIINQVALATCFDRLDTVDASILNFIVDFAHTGRMVSKIHDKKIYYWIKYTYVIENMPLLRISSRDAIYRRLRKLCECDILAAHPDNQISGRAFYCFGSKYELTTMQSDDDRLQPPAQTTKGTAQTTEGYGADNEGYGANNGGVRRRSMTDKSITDKSIINESISDAGATRQKNDASNETPKIHNAPAQTHGSVAPGAVTRATLTAFQTFCMEHDLAVIAAWPDVCRDADHVARLAQFGHAQYLAELQAANGAKWKRKVKSGHRTLINWFKRIDAGTSLHNPAAVPDDRLLLAKKMATIYRAKYQETNNVPTKIKATDRDVLLELSDLIDETNPGADRLMAWGKWVDMLMLMTPTRKDAFDWRSKPLRGLLNNYGMITAQMMKTHAPMQAMSAAERESANAQNDILVQAARQAAADMEERRQEKERKAAAKRAARRAEIEANGGYDIYGRKVIFKD